MKRLDHYWYSKNPVALLLLPLSWLFCAVVALRRYAYRTGLLPSYRLSAPVIVVGNITVGGSGKTPLVLWLVEFLREAGYKPGIISRGYGGRSNAPTREVNAKSDPVEVGDEAVLLARRCACPVSVAADRVAAARNLLDECDVIISDDGLQHYRLRRDIEIAVVDAGRGFGNGFCLPAGPLREPLRRLQEVNLIVNNGKRNDAGFTMRLQELALYNLHDESLTRHATDFRGQTVHAIAGMGHPARFFTHLRRLGLEVIEHGFPDHHPFTADEIEFGDAAPVIMTEKDAVKCKRFAEPHHWTMPVQAELESGFGERLLTLLKDLPRKPHG
ncbi:MAG: tetraacyldisaccharide 4'-kinase [Gammaproteobacteria bacterium]